MCVKDSFHFDKGILAGFSTLVTLFEEMVKENIELGSATKEKSGRPRMTLRIGVRRAMTERNLRDGD